MTSKTEAELLGDIAHRLGAAAEVVAEAAYRQAERETLKRVAIGAGIDHTTESTIIVERLGAELERRQSVIDELTAENAVMRSHIRQRNDRPRDEYGRVLYEHDEIPPVSDQFAVWRGKVVRPGPATAGNSVGGCHPSDGRRPYATCTNGWVESGAWWLHCYDCHDATP